MLSPMNCDLTECSTWPALAWRFIFNRGKHRSKRKQAGCQNLLNGCMGIVTWSMEKGFRRTKPFGNRKIGRVWETPSNNIFWGVCQRGEDGIEGSKRHGRIAKENAVHRYRVEMIWQHENNTAATAEPHPNFTQSSGVHPMQLCVQDVFSFTSVARLVIEMPAVAFSERLAISDWSRAL